MSDIEYPCNCTPKVMDGKPYHTTRCEITLRNKIEALQEEIQRLRDALEKIADEYVELMDESALEYGGKYDEKEDRLYQQAQQALGVREK